MRKYSIIIPVYNRPVEIDELLESLTHQTLKNFEVLVVDDGSEIDSKKVVEKYREHLDVKYFHKENSGQGFTRNFGFKNASGDFFIVFDSDCIIPPHYLETVDKHLNENNLDAFGGPDRDHKSFTPIQKAISYSMTSPFTTGGIRGSEKSLGAFHPRSFNMGISREVFQTTGGYLIPKMGEDIEFSIRIINSGFKAGLIKDAFVYHKRRTNFLHFFKQLHFFGRARINVSRFHPREIKLVYTFPAIFTIGVFVWLAAYYLMPLLFFMGTGLLAVYFILILVDSTIKNKSILVGLLSIPASFIQLFAYGIGFLTEGFRKIIPFGKNK